MRNQFLLLAFLFSAFIVGIVVVSQRQPSKIRMFVGNSQTGERHEVSLNIKEIKK